MSQITAQDEMRAALHRLREASGYPAVESLLKKIGAGSVRQVSEADYETVMRECPPLREGEGIAVGTGDKKPSTRDALNSMALDRNAKNGNAPPAEDIAADMKTVLEGEGGFDAAGKAMNARGGPKQAKAK